MSKEPQPTYVPRPSQAAADVQRLRARVQMQCKRIESQFFRGQPQRLAGGSFSIEGRCYA